MASASAFLPAAAASPAPDFAGRKTADSAGGDGRPTVFSQGVTLPKGGGAIRGIGEKFAANPVTGTGTFTVPILTSPGRRGFGPQLTLSYDTGSGNGVFGFGWSLGLPSISRRTDKGLPRYADAVGSDIYVLSGAEDLVPVLAPDGTPSEDEATAPGYAIGRYRPRVERAFARIERWRRLATGETHWRTISRDNVTTLYGRTNDSRIFDPADPTPATPARVFRWLICASYDDKGNAVVYEYVAENDDNIDLRQGYERNRVRSANRYPKRIRYGNRAPNRDAAWNATDPAALPAVSWMFDVVFDYGDGHYSEDVPDARGRVYAQAQMTPPTGATWPARQDAFSDFRAGFERRTHRLCRRVLMFHHFPQELGIDDCLVRSSEFLYSESPTASFVRSAVQSGYVRDSTANVPDRYLKRSLPPVDFDYSPVPGPAQFAGQPVRELDRESLADLPVDLRDAGCSWVDLDGEGAVGMLTEQANGWHYKRNLSANNAVDGEIAAQFGPAERVAAKTAVELADGAGFFDLDGDGRVDLVQTRGAVRGFHARTAEAGWEPFAPFVSWPTRDMDDPDLRLVDLTGDGLADILITEGEALTWHPGLAEEGFGPGIRVNLPSDEERGPRVVFADPQQSIFLADMSGDGLSDLVRIRNGEVSYWPNVGYGRFGPRITMENAPWFDAPDQFDQRRIRLADVDGSGTADIFYLRRDGARLYLNQSGNRWGDAVALPQLPPADDVSTVQALDLLGRGTACLLWTSPLPGTARRAWRYLALIDEKPHLLVGVKNNLGAETAIRYAPSTKFYLDDRRDGRLWVTRLPFPVHVVERVEISDRLSRNRFVTRYAYHHGYFDGIEREFCGFGLVEQWDTVEFAALASDGRLRDTGNLDAASQVPPVLTRTWFHTGVYVGRDHVSDFYAGLLDANDRGEYFREPGLSDEQARAQLLPDTVLPAGLTADEEREACRGLKGSMLRQEVYALDDTPRAAFPYSVTEQNFAVRCLQQKGRNTHAVFFTHAGESLVSHYERDPVDPRVQHALTLEVDGFGNVLKSAAVGYGRRQSDGGLPAEDQERQARMLVTFGENHFTNAVDAADAYRTPAPAGTYAYELTGYVPTGPAGRYQKSDFVAPDPAHPGRFLPVYDEEILYEQSAVSGRQRRLIGQTRMLYRKDDLSSLLPPGELEGLALAGESYKLAFTPGLLAQTFQRDNQALLPEPAGVLGAPGEDRGGYVDLDGDGRWWVPSGRVFLSPGGNDTPGQESAWAQQHFYLPQRSRDPFHTTATPIETVVTYDAHDLLTLEIRDPLGNRTTAGQRLAGGVIDPAIAGNDYRVLQPCLVADPNRNRVAAAFDALGMVVGTAVMGKPGEAAGDTLDGFEADPADGAVFDAAGNLTADPRALLGFATMRIVHDLFAYQRSAMGVEPQPAFVYTMARETHVADLAAGEQSAIRQGFSYSDGFGREMQSKAQAEPGPVPARGGDGRIVLGADGQPVITANVVTPRWVTSGKTIFNNKGNAVRKYEPFFTDLARYEFDPRVGVSAVLFYDPAGRAVGTLHPDHTWEKVVFDPWRQESWDVNDTVLIADPAQDADLGAFFARLPDADYLPGWYDQRKAGALGPAEQDAAQKAAIHAATPTVAHADTLGRTFLTIAHNRWKYSDALPTDPPEEGLQSCRSIVDIQGNQRKVIDTGGRVVMRYDYDMLGHRTRIASMEAGVRWTLNDITGKTIRAWDSRDHAFRATYDSLRRPVGSYLREGNGTEILAVRTQYGESQADPENRNQRGKIVRVSDQAGIAVTDAYDFKGNSLRSSRQLAREYKTTPDWSAAVPLEPAIDASSSHYDALNRVTQHTTPDGSVTRPDYNEAGLLERLQVGLHGAAVTVFVSNIDYDAKGQRTRIDYGNGVGTAYDYDPLTFRPRRVRTIRAADALQELQYAYDPAGNVTGIRDDAQQTIFFRNRRVEPGSGYVYDAVYRLIEATGREHLGQAGGQVNPPTTPDAFDTFHTRLDQPGDGNAMGTYLERYLYDAAGNILSMRHQGSDPAHPGWARDYTYHEPGLLEPFKSNNRLTRTMVGTNNAQPTADLYAYDEHGNVIQMAHLSLMQWDYRDQLQATAQQVVNNGGTPELTYYVYDAAGQRVRKITERHAAAGQSTARARERIYLGGCELYREYAGDGDTVALERETLHVMDGQRRVALVETRTKGDDTVPPQVIRYQLGNHLGSASLELDHTAAIISYEEYYPYGSTSYQAGRSSVEVGRKRYRYTGMERDEESGFGYHGARYYASWLGRWTSCDPTGLSDGLNLYEYVRSAPTRLTDPAGTEGRVPTEEEMARTEARYRELKQGFLAGVPRFDFREDSDQPLTPTQIAVMRARVTKLWAEVRKLNEMGETSDASLVAHIIGDLTFEANMGQRRWDNLSDSAKGYWGMILDHPEMRVGSTPLNQMTGAIVDESMSADVQVFQGAVVGTLTAHAISASPPASGAKTVSGEFEAREISNPKIQDEPTVVDSDADYSGVSEKSANLLKAAAARRTGNYVTFDVAIRAAGAANKALMKAINEWLGPEKKGTPNWQTGTHGDAEGNYGKPGQVDDRFLQQDKASGKYKNWNAIPFQDPLPPVYGPGNVCVFGWCFSTASLAKRQR